MFYKLGNVFPEGEKRKILIRLKLMFQASNESGFVEGELRCTSEMKKMNKRRNNFKIMQ